MIFDYGQDPNKRSEVMQGAMDAGIQDAIDKMDGVVTQPADQEPSKPLTAESVMQALEEFKLKYPDEKLGFTPTHYVMPRQETYEDFMNRNMSEIHEGFETFSQPVTLASQKESAFLLRQQAREDFKNNPFAVAMAERLFTDTIFPKHEYLGTAIPIPPRTPFAEFKKDIINEMGRALCIPKKVWCAPMNTDDGYISIHEMARQFKNKFGKLPCGKSNRSRMVKKRRKKIMKWYKERS